MAALGACALALAACHGKGGANTDQLDNELIGNAGDNQTDPALTSALEDQIMVDPSLTQQSNDHSARSTGGPVQAPIPPSASLVVPPEPTAGGKKLQAPAPTRLAPDGGRGTMTLGALAEEQSKSPKGATRGCAPDLEYSQAWAQRLPLDVPLFPNAVVSEAAGDDAPGCRVRIVSFSTSAPLKTVIDFYYTKAVRSGFDARHLMKQEDHILEGTRDLDGSAYYLIVTPRANGGSDVDLITNIGD
ncbi:hypothetical protein [Flavisphingomonas formosensis]|uniref:hypothetical protein n=1 Tax=Flavisphingomonas formosensis TaxID=861534 RepID=UPI0012F7E997|nr:hypothetical protein [Sphingomonas formosensis]